MAKSDHPRFPRSLVVIVVIILIVVVAVVALRVRSTSGGGGPATSVIVTSGSNWSVGPMQYHAARFTVTANVTVQGEFATFGGYINMLLMNDTQFNDFANNSTVTSLNSTGPSLGSMINWSIDATGIYYLVAWNIGSSGTAHVDWLTAAQWVA